MKNGHVCLGADRHYYSVPYKYIGKKIKILFTSLVVEIYYQYEKIAIYAGFLFFIYVLFSKTYSSIKMH